MALQNNLDIVVSRLDTQVRTEGVNSARGVYKPFLSFALNTFDSASPAQNQLVGAQTLTSTRTNYNFTWTQQISTGGDYTIQWLNLRSTTNSAFCRVQPVVRHGRVGSDPAAADGEPGHRCQQAANSRRPQQRAYLSQPVRASSDGYGA